MLKEGALLLWQSKRHSKIQNSLLKRPFWRHNIIVTFLMVLFISLFTISSLALSASSFEVSQMFGLFKRHSVEMSPEVRGRISDGGNPVVGIRVARSLVYEGYEKGKEQLEHVITDESGAFYFEPMVIKSRMPGDIFGQNIPVKQVIYIERGEHLYRLWNTSKVWEPIKPLSDLLIQLNCDLQDKQVQHLIDTSSYGGRVQQSVSSICHWQGDLISTYYDNELISSYDEINQ